MIISEKQLLLLIQVLKSTIGIRNLDVPHEIRLNLYNSIIHQQSDELKEINDD